ncbi:uncharacterized protein LOC111135956 [Crassostrea virginica]
MDVRGRHLVRSVIVFVFLLNANSLALLDFHKCADSVLRLGRNYKSVYSHCNCTIAINFSGGLYFVSQNCGTSINIRNRARNYSIPLPCSGSRETSKAKVVKGDILHLISTYDNNFSTDSKNEIQNISIFAYSNVSGLFSVTCGPEFGAITTRKSSPISRTYTIKATKKYASTNTATHGSYRNLSLDGVTFKTSTSFGFSKASPKETAKGFLTTDMVYAVTAASVVVIFVLTALVVLYLRRRNLTCKKNNENTREPGTNHDTTDPADVLYHSHQSNADGEGYSTCTLETRNLREELPANPLYQSYEENSAVDPLTPLQIKEDIYQRVSENVQYSHSAVDPRTSLQVMEDIYHRVSENVPDNNSVYSYVKPFKSSNKELNLVESQNDNVYAQVSKPKKK